jgi:hypothetical protein
VFGFAEWDSWLSFIMEGALSLAVLVGLVLLARRVNANAEAERQRRTKDEGTTRDEGVESKT